MTLQLLHSEFSNIWGKFDFLFISASSFYHITSCFLMESARLSLAPSTSSNASNVVPPCVGGAYTCIRAHTPVLRTSWAHTFERSNLNLVHRAHALVHSSLHPRGIRAKPLLHSSTTPAAFEQNPRCIRAHTIVHSNMCPQSHTLEPTSLLISHKNVHSSSHDQVP